MAVAVGHAHSAIPSSCKKSVVLSASEGSIFKNKFFVAALLGMTKNDSMPGNRPHTHSAIPNSCLEERFLL